VIGLGGLYVIGTNRHESRRIDDQLRGRSGRKEIRHLAFFSFSLEDPLMVRFGLEGLIPRRVRPARQEAPLDHPIIRREVERHNASLKGQNHEIRTTLSRYSDLLEKQRNDAVCLAISVLCRRRGFDGLRHPVPGRYAEWRERFGAEKMLEVERAVTLQQIDAVWSDHLAFIAEVREVSICQH